jgi:hypothetical protein
VTKSDAVNRAAGLLDRMADAHRQAVKHATRMEYTTERGYTAQYQRLHDELLGLVEELAAGTSTEPR